MSASDSHFGKPPDLPPTKSVKEEDALPLPLKKEEGEREAGSGSSSTWVWPMQWADRFAGTVFLLGVIILDTVRLHYQEYSVGERWLLWQGIKASGEAAPIFWPVAFMDLAHLIMLARLVMLVIPSSREGRRWLTPLFGLPLLAAGMAGLDLAFFFLLQSLSLPGERLSAVIIFIVSLGVAGGCVAWAVGLGLGEGGKSGEILRYFLKTLELSVPLILPWFSGLKLTYFLLLIPYLGPLLRSVLNLFFFLWFLRFLGRRAEGFHYQAAAPGPVSALICASVTLVLLFLSAILPGPHAHWDAIDAPSLLTTESSLLPSKYQESENRVSASTSRLTLLLEKKPFFFQVLDKNGRPLLELHRSPPKSQSCRSAAANFELRGLKTFPGRRVGRLLSSRLGISAISLSKLANLRNRGSELIGEGGGKARTMVASFSFVDENALMITLDPGPRSPSQTTSLAFACGPDENFLVAGTQGGEDLRGRALDFMIMNSRGFPRPSTGRFLKPSPILDPRRWPVPFIFLSRGAGLFLAESADPAVELIGRHSEAIRFSSRGGPLRLLLVSGDNPVEAVKNMNRLRPAKAKTPPSALMPWTTLSVTEACQGEALAEMQALRTAGIPAENVFLSGPLSRFASDGQPTTLCSGLAQAIALAPALGFNLIFTDQAILPRSDPRFKLAAKNGYLLLNRLGLPFLITGEYGLAGIIDFTNPAAVKWRSEEWRKLKNSGFAGMALDPGALPPPESILYNGMNGEEARNLFPLFYARAAREALGGEAVLLSETGFAGMEQFTVLAWPGAEPAEELSQAEIAGLLSLGMTGVATGPPAPTGFLSNSVPDASRLKALNLATASGLMVLPPRVRDLVRSNRSTELRTLVVLAEIHSRLLPYLYSLLAEHAHLPPLTAPIALLKPEDGTFYETGQFLVGESLVAALTDMVRLPAGRFVHLETLALYGEGEFRVGGAIGPRLFLREGQILPVFSRAVESLSGMEREGFRRGSLEKDELTILWISGPAAEFTLFDGVRISAAWGMETITLRIFGGASRTYTWRVLWCAEPKTVYVNGKELDAGQWRFQPSSGVLTISHLQGPNLNVDVDFPSPFEEIR